MNLIVGLGNIGTQYSETRHNVGFKVVDSILEKFPFRDVSKASFKGELFKINESDLENTLLLKPSTFMNLSGESTIAVTQFFKLDFSTDENRAFIIYDDLDLPFGAIRFKKGGGTGGHNGLKSIQNMDKSLFENAIRVRLGIGKPQHKDHSISDYVLGKFSDEEQKCLDIWYEKSRDAVLKMIKGKNWERVASLNSAKNIAKICKS